MGTAVQTLCLAIAFWEQYNPSFSRKVEKERSLPRGWAGRGPWGGGPPRLSAGLTAPPPVGCSPLQGGSPLPPPGPAEAGRWLLPLSLALLHLLCLITCLHKAGQLTRAGIYGTAGLGPGCAVRCTRASSVILNPRGWEKKAGSKRRKSRAWRIHPSMWFSPDCRGTGAPRGTAQASS